MKFKHKTFQHVFGIGFLIAVILTTTTTVTGNDFFVKLAIAPSVISVISIVIYTIYEFKKK